MSLNKFHVNVRIYEQNKALTYSRSLPVGHGSFQLLIFYIRLIVLDLQLVVCRSTWSGCCADHPGLSDNYDTMTTVKA